MSQNLSTFPDTDAAWFRHVTNALSSEQLLWLSGYSYGLAIAKGNANQNGVQPAFFQPLFSPALMEDKPLSSTETNATPMLVTILYGSHTGNSKKVALRAAEHARTRGVMPIVHDMAEYPLKNLKSERNLLVIVSTHGEGTPPLAAEEIHTYLHSTRAPKLTATSFSVLALGDRSYLHFCKAGADFDAQLEKLGATRLYPRVDCDVDFDDDADAWIDATLASILAKSAQNLPSAASSISSNRPSAFITSPICEIASTPVYSKKHPFSAPLLEKIQLNGRGSAKETYHLEFSLEGSGLVYEPGDSLGVIAENSPHLVEEVLCSAHLSGSELIGDEPLYDALRRNVELTILTRDVLAKHNEFAHSSELASILSDTTRLQSYLYGHDIADMLQDFPVQHTAESLVQILRKLPHRLYSIASSLTEHENEAHLTVGAVRYHTNGRRKEGVASCFLADRVGVESTVKVFVERNESFKLPSNSSTDIIMISSGTGIAPFRAFLEERAATGATGKNWLFFGNPHFTTDFLYQTEWQQWLKKGTLTKLNVAFSRDQAQKIYVQHKLLANSKEIFAWLHNGASLYVCGDKNRMAHDVEAAITQIVQDQSDISPEKAVEAVKSLKKQRRYLEDVY